VAALNVGGLLIIGVQYALLLGVIGALLNVVPYIGGLVATALAMMVALATQEPAAALWVLLLFLGVQFVDNNFIVPRIVASRVEVNALASIIVVMIGGALWGVPGMFLSLPLTAVIKIMCDRIPALQPFGYVLGDEQPREKQGHLPTAQEEGYESGTTCGIAAIIAAQNATSSPPAPHPRGDSARSHGRAAASTAIRWLRNASWTRRSEYRRHSAASSCERVFVCMFIAAVGWQFVCGPPADHQKKTMTMNESNENKGTNPEWYPRQHRQPPARAGER
jgi:hypothetical protein